MSAQQMDAERALELKRKKKEKKNQAKKMNSNERGGKKTSKPVFQAALVCRGLGKGFRRVAF